MKKYKIILGVFLILVCGAADLYPQSGETGGAAPAHTAAAASVPAAAASAPATAPAAKTTTIALHPFKGTPQNIVSDFYSVLQEVLPKVKDGIYTPYLIDLNHLPPDVPEGGYPAYICPSPSVTHDAPYALTGEVIPDSDNPGEYALRLYLWKIADDQLLSSDEMDAQDKDSCREALPWLLESMLAKIEQEKKPEQEKPTAGSASIIPEPDIEHWLYLGLRGGASLRFFTMPQPSLFMDTQAMHFYNLNAAFQGAVHLLKYFDIQIELNFSTDYAPFDYFTPPGNVDTMPFSSQYLTIPLLFRSNIRKGHLLAGALGGIYVFLPLGQMKNDVMGGSFDYISDVPLGYTLGINSGMKLGPGYLFLDIRWAADLGSLKKDSGETLYQRSMVTLNIGYEIGFIEKKKAGEKKPEAKKHTGTEEAEAEKPEEEKPPEEAPAEESP